jgi:hypothetical protein
MTYLYVDTEFNGHGGALISMAVVSDDGREWYEVHECPDPIHPWVAEHVMPKLRKPAVSGAAFRQSLHQFLDQFDTPTVFVDWPADLVHFFNSFVGETYENVLRLSCKAILFQGKAEFTPDDPHNALSDARALRDWHQAQIRR